jgi:hypothetical protein
MSVATLLVIPDDPRGAATFGFEHAMAHRSNLGAMTVPYVFNRGVPVAQTIDYAGGLSQFSVIPYFVDPNLNQQNWHVNHAQAHWDMNATLPSYPGAIDTFGVHSGNILLDMNRNRGQWIWWTFVNLQEHRIAGLVRPDDLVYPFW